MSQTPHGEESRRHGAGDDSPGSPHPESAAPRTRSRWLVPLILGVLLVAILGTLVVVALSGAEDESAQGPLPGEVEATETPTDRGEQSPDPTASPTDVPTEGPEETDREVTDRPLEDLLDPIIIDTEFELTEEGWSTDEDALEQGAEEAVVGRYTDGEREVVTTAAAFETIEQHDAYAEALVAEQPAEDLRSEGTVYSDESGRYWAFQHPDGQATVIWRTDIGVVLTVSGEAAAASAVFANMSI